MGVYVHPSILPVRVRYQILSRNLPPYAGTYRQFPNRPRQLRECQLRQHLGIRAGVAGFAPGQGRVEHAPRSGQSPLTGRKPGKENCTGPSGISCHWA